MKELQLETEFELSEKELKNLKESILNLIPDKNKVLKQNLNTVIEFNINRKENEELVINSNFKENRKQINKILKNNFKHDNIIKIYINSKNILIKEIKLTLNNLYNEFINNYLSGIIKEMSEVIYIKIYDFYKEEQEQLEIFDKLKNDKEVKSLIKKLYPKNAKCNLQILTDLNSKESFDFYQDIYNYNNNVKIKYIPESTSKNIYISSLFFMLVKYRVKNSKNYKEILLYLEPSTNWGIVAKSHNVGFISKYIKLLNYRYDEQFYNKNKLDFKPINKPTYNNFKKDINQIFTLIKEELDTDKTGLDNKVLLEIHKLKTKYRTIEYAYKLLKSFYYIIIYSHTIKNKMKYEELIHTQYVVNMILDNEYIDIIKSNFIKMNQRKFQEKYKDVDLKKLRIGVIESINNKIALCDIFPYMNWTKQHKIFQNFDYILNDNEKLDLFYEKIGMKEIINTKNKTEYFTKNIIPRIIKGNKIIINNLN